MTDYLRQTAWLSCYDLVSVNDGPTRMHHDGGLSRLDLIVEPSKPRRLSVPKTVLVGFSDHKLLKAVLSCSRPPAASATYSYRDLKHIDILSFRAHLRQSTSLRSPPEDPDEIVRQLHVDLRSVLDRFAPLRTRTKRQGKVENRWLSDAAVQAKRIRRKLERRYSKSRSSTDRRAYRRACRTANTVISEARSSFIRSEVEEAAASSPRLLWRTVSRLLHPGSNSNWFDGMDTPALAEGFCAFFSDKVLSVKEAVVEGLKSLQVPIPQIPHLAPPGFLPGFTVVTDEEVYRLIQAAPTKTSPLDILPISLLKQCSSELSSVITHLANRSFQTGRFPSLLKSGLVTPLLKKPGLDTSDFKNFRPITNLSTISKILERLALARLKPHIVSSPNYCPLQSAYRTAYSTETALVKVVDDIIGCIDSGSVVAVVGLDISAAFDTVRHRTLLDRLESEFGICGMTLDWLSSYLSDRSFSVRVGTDSSGAVPVYAGVPQGSVLGPLLFTTYISPIGRLMEMHGIQYHKYADDTQLYTSLTVPAELSLDRLESCTSELQHWYWANDLLLNPSKSEVALFGTRQRLLHSTLPPNVSVAGSSVVVNDVLKILGVTLDSTLTFDVHVNNVVRSCNYHLRALRHLRPYLSLDIAKTIAVSIVGSRLDYCNALLFGATQSTTSKLQRVQNNLARVVCDVGWRKSNTADLLHDLHWLPVRSRVTFKVATLCYQTYRNGQPAYLPLSLYIPPRNLRSASLVRLFEPPARLAIGERRFSYHAPRVWNSLPMTVRSADSLASFKTRLKTHLFDTVNP